jgi:TRAP-type C4-dicarboxylate transport system substrate-binding protein
MNSLYMKGVVEMKKTKQWGTVTFVCFSLILMAAGVLRLVCGQAMAADKITLVLEVGMPQSVEQSWAGTGKPWTEAVTRRTEGEVVFDTHFGGKLYSMMKMVEGTGSGGVQVGAPFTGYFPPLFPVEALLGTLNYPAFTAPDPTRIAITRILFTEIPAFNDAYKKNNIKKIFTISVPNVGIQSRVPISNIGDFKGLKIRTLGKYMEKSIRAVGAIPINMGYDGTIEAIAKKTLDATIINFSKARDTSLHKVAPHLVWLGDKNMPAHVIPYAYVMNLDAWNKLPQRIKRIMLEEGKKVEMAYAVQSMNEQMAATKQMEKEGGTIHRLSEQDMKEWETRCGDLGLEAAKELDDKGLPGTQTITLIRKLAKLSQAELMAEYDKAWEKEFSLIQ